MPNYTVTSPNYTSISATKWSRRVEIIEDGSTMRGGLLCKFPDDNFTVPYEFPPDQQPIVLGNMIAHGGGHGATVGRPAQTGLPPALATELVRITAVSGTTDIRVTEID